MNLWIFACDIGADIAGMTVVLDNGSGDRGKAVTVTMATNLTLHRCDRLERGLCLASSNIHRGFRNAQMGPGPAAPGAAEFGGGRIDHHRLLLAEVEGL